MTARPSRPKPPAELWPTNVTRLRTLGVEHDWRQSRREIVLVCPICRGRLILDDERPWAYCAGDLKCRAGKMNFGELLELLNRPHRFESPADPHQDTGMDRTTGAGR